MKGGLQVCLRKNNDHSFSNKFHIFFSGPSLPFRLANPIMVTSPTGKGVVILGGMYSRTMFELTDSMEWEQLDKTLQHDYSGPLAVPIPDNLTCEISNESISGEICTCVKSTCLLS